MLPKVKSVHMPTAVTVLIVVVVLLGIYHFAHKH